MKKLASLLTINELVPTYAFKVSMKSISLDSAHHMPNQTEIATEVFCPKGLLRKLK